MKNFGYLLLLAVMLLFTACPGEIIDPDDPIDDVAALLRQKIEKVVPSDVLKMIKEMGMPINEGVTPPNIEGKYLADDQTMKKSNIQDDNPVGTKYEEEVLTISGQNNTNFSVTLRSETDSYTQTHHMIISGNGDRFTLYAPFKITLDDNSTANAVLLYSGRIKEGDLYELHYGLFMIDKPYSGLGQIMYEADGVAKKAGGTTEPEIITATGGTATGTFKGNDLIMKFSSNLQLSISAAMNPDAPHEEITIVERKENEMFNLGNNIILDFSKMQSAYSVKVEATIEKGLDAEEDIDCSLFTTDKQTVEEAKGIIYKKVDFTYNKATGKLALSFQANAPFNATKSGDTSKGRYNYLSIALTPNYNYVTENITMKAPYVEQMDQTCWAACAMMFVRSYTNLDPGLSNGLLTLVKRIGHATLDQGWGTNFLTYWDYDSGSIVDAITEMIGGGVKISCSSFRKPKNAATEMTKLLKKRHPIVLNHGEHVLYVIGYKREENAGPVSFLVHDPQGVGGDIYKWIDWEQYIKKIGFKEAWFRGDALYILYADRPMLDNPVLQTMATPACNTNNVMCPAGADLSFTMSAYGNGRQVFPKYNLDEKDGIYWEKLGYDEQNKANDTIYSPTKLNVSMRVYNADDKAVSMLLNMDISGGGIYKSYLAEFNCPAKGVYMVKGDNFNSSGEAFDPSLSPFFEKSGNREITINIALRNVWGQGYIDELVYEGLIVKSKAVDEPAEFKAFRLILKDIYTSVTGKPWSDELVWLQKNTYNQWGYDIYHKDQSTFLIRVNYENNGTPYFTIQMNNYADYTKDLKVTNHKLPGDWTWHLYSADIQSKVVKIENDQLSWFRGGENLNEVTISSATLCTIEIDKRKNQTNKDLKLDLKQTPIRLVELSGVSKTTINSARHLDRLGFEYCEKGTVILPGDCSIDIIDIHANNFTVVGINDTIGGVNLYDVTNQPQGKISLTGLNCERVSSSLNIYEFDIADFTSEKLKIQMNFNDTKVKKISIKNAPNLTSLSILGGAALEDLIVTGTPPMDTASLTECYKLGGPFSQWPQFLQEMYNNGKSLRFAFKWRYSYVRQYGGSSPYEFTDNGYGFYFDSSEPETVDMNKYITAGRYPPGY